MQIKYLKDELGAGRFGTCVNCGKGTDEDSNIRRLSFESSLSSICLCSECFPKIIRLMEQEAV